MRELIDIHVHFGSPDGPDGICYWSKNFEKSIAFLAMKIVTGSLFKKANFDGIRSHIFKVINGSKYTDKVVLLALDQVYGSDGKPDKRKTNLYTSNECILKLKHDFKEKFGEDKILFGMSINPNRTDWKEELEKYKNRAVLCKWLPSAQNINPNDLRFDPFYEKLAEYNIPLLSHAGPEHAIPSWDKEWNKLNNPSLLRRALSKGVTVIVAHCALPYFPDDKIDDFKTLISMINESEDKGWSLYSDLSALCVPFRNPYIKDVQNRIKSSLLLYGSDYPIPIVEFSYKKSKNIFRQIWIFLKAVFTKNPLDKNYYLLKKMGFNENVFTNASDIFKTGPLI